MPSFPETAATAGQVFSVQGQAKRKSRVRLVSKIVQVQGVGSVPLDQQGFPALAGQGPGLDQGIQEVSRVAPQDDRADGVFFVPAADDDRGNCIELRSTVAGARMQIPEQRPPFLKSLHNRAARCLVQGTEPSVQAEPHSAA